jgi:hypothetical protein
MKIFRVGAELFHVGGQKDKHNIMKYDKMKIITSKKLLHRGN